MSSAVYRRLNLITHVIDMQVANSFLAGLESLAHEARMTKDVRILIYALEILSDQRLNVQRILGREGKSGADR